MVLGNWRLIQNSLVSWLHFASLSLWLFVIYGENDLIIHNLRGDEMYLECIKGVVLKIFPNSSGRYKRSYCFVELVEEFVWVESYDKWRVNAFGELRLQWRHKYSNSPSMTSQNNLSLRFLINTVTLLLLIFRRVSR